MQERTSLLAAHEGANPIDTLAIVGVLHLILNYFIAYLCVLRTVICLSIGCSSVEGFLFHSFNNQILTLLFEYDSLITSI